MCNRAKLQILQPSSFKVREHEVVLKALGQVAITVFSQPLLYLGIQQEWACYASKATWLISLATAEV